MTMHNKKSGVTAVFIGVLSLVVALGVTSRPAVAAVKVIATVPDLAALAHEIGGEAVTVKALSLASQDPHFVDAKPSLALELNRAQLLLHVGLDLEIGWLPTLLVGARNPDIQAGAAGNLDCSQFVTRLDVPAQAIDRSHGDIHPGGNPHYLYDPRAALAVATGIAQRLGEIDSAHAGVYRGNLATFKRHVEAARARWEKRFAPARGTPIIGYHRTWSYLADWLGLEQVGFLEPKPGLPPNPRHVAGLLTLAKSRKVKLILQETYYPDATSKLVASNVPAKLVEITSGANVNTGEGYLQHLDVMLEAIASALGLPQ
jgi:zinc/manganese transport system substrate-binding protein